MTYFNPKWGFAPKYVFNESVNRERLRFLAQKDMPLVAYSCLCKGAYEDITRLPDEYEKGDRAEKILSMAADRGVTPSAIVVAWLTSLCRLEGYPRIIPLFSARAEHLEKNLKGLDITLSDSELAAMNETK
jgi:aryl-alcohol dehydrogenase-like predicted oxidoreductase